MGMPAAEIESMIKDAFPDAEVTIQDLRGDGDHYAATVVSAAFKGKMGGQLHALALETKVPAGA